MVNVTAPPGAEDPGWATAITAVSVTGWPAIAGLGATTSRVVVVACCAEPVAVAVATMVPVVNDFTVTVTVPWPNAARLAWSRMSPETRPGMSNVAIDRVG